MIDTRHVMNCEMSRNFNQKYVKSKRAIIFVFLHLELLLCFFIKIKIYGTIILSNVLYGCETWSLTLREERRLRVFENRVLRRIFGPKRDEATGKWGKLHNEEPNDPYSVTQYCWGDRIDKNEMGGACSAYGG